MPSQTIIYEVIIHPNLVPFADIPALQEKLADFEPILDLSGELISDYQKQNFADDGATFGAPWAPLAPFTLREKRRLGYPDKTLLREGNIRDNIGQSVSVDANSVTVGISRSVVPYAQYHDDPATGSRLPQRVLVSVTDEMVETLLTLLREWLAQGTGQAIEGIEINAQVVSN